MENFKKIGVLTVVLLLGIVIGGAYSQNGSLGGLVHIAEETFVNGVNSNTGYKVNGTSVIDSSGNWDGAVTAASASTFASTVAITGATSIEGETSINGGLTYGDAAWSTSTTNTSETFTEANLLAYNYLRLMSNTGATTYTLPATSTMTTLIPNAGDTREWIFENATSGSGITATIAAGAGIELKSLTANDDVIDETEVAELKCVRKPSTDVICIVSELADSD